MLSQVKVIVEITIPTGATHYSGLLVDHPTYYKTKAIAGHPYWFCYDPEREEWMLSGEPCWCHELNVYVGVT